MIRHGSVALLYLLTTGCGAGWQRIPGPWPGELETRQQAQVWSAGFGMLAMVAMLVASCRSQQCDIGN